MRGISASAVEASTCLSSIFASLRKVASRPNICQGLQIFGTSDVTHLSFSSFTSNTLRTPGKSTNRCQEGGSKNGIDPKQLESQSQDLLNWHRRFWHCSPGTGDTGHCLTTGQTFGSQPLSFLHRSLPPSPHLQRLQDGCRSRRRGHIDHRGIAPRSGGHRATP